MITTYERGILQGERASTVRQLEAKFGGLDAGLKACVEALRPEELHRLQIDLLRAESLEALRLADRAIPEGPAESEG